MRIIALMNQKGGVGKTTTTVNLGAALAEQGARVCLIDLDPQAHLTINYGVEPSREICSLYNVLVDEQSILEAVHTVGDRIGLVPSSIDLAAAEIELVSVLGREMLLKKRMEAAGVSEEFDYVLLDCPPSLGLLTVNALATAHEVIIPMQAHFLALQGVAKLLETVQLVNRRMNPKLRVSGIVLTMFDAQTKLSMEVVNELNGFIEQAKGKNLPWSSARVFKTRVRRNIKLAECPSFGQTILAYESSSNGAADYRALAKEVASMAALVGEVETAASAAPAAKTEPFDARQPGHAAGKVARPDIPAPVEAPLKPVDRTAAAKAPTPTEWPAQKPAAVAHRPARPATPIASDVDGAMVDVHVPPLPLPPPPMSNVATSNPPPANPPKSAVEVAINPKLESARRVASAQSKPAKPATDAEVAA